MVEAGEGGDSTTIYVIEANMDLSDELKVALSEMGLNLLATNGGATKCSAISATGEKDNQPGRLRFAEPVHLDLPDTHQGDTGRGCIAIKALIDTGADVSCISQGLAKELGIEPLAEAASIRINGAGGVTPAITLPGILVYIRKYSLQVNFLMLPLGTSNLILGLDVLTALGATITCSPKGVEFNPEGNLRLGEAVNIISQEGVPEESRTVGSITEHVDPIAGWADRANKGLGVPEDLHYSDSENFTYMDEKEPQFTEEEFCAKLALDFAWFKFHELEYAEATALLREFRSVFARNVDVSRPIKVPPMVINTTTESPVGSYRPDRFTPDQYNFLDKELPRLLDLRVLRTSTSQYNSPILLKEKAGPVKWRMTNDFRELNAATIPFPAVVPLIADVMEAISEGNFFF